MQEVMQYIGLVLLGVGTLFLFLGSLGVFRMPDVYSRMQAGTKSTTLGAIAFILGVGFLQPEWFWKAFIIVSFITVSNPISSHALARGSHLIGIRPFSKDGIDAYYDDRFPEEAQKEAKNDVPQGETK